MEINKGFTMEDSQGEIILTGQDLKAKWSNYKNNNGWNGNTKSRTTSHLECQICQRIGYIAPNYFYRTAQSTSPHFNTECQICGKMGHSALECYHRGNYSYQPSGLLASTFYGI